MEKDKRRKKVDDTKPDAEDVIDELLEGVDLKQGAPEEADSKYLNQTLERPHLIDDSCVWRIFKNYLVMIFKIADINQFVPFPV